jgi:hypothetical protein
MERQMITVAHQFQKESTMTEEVRDDHPSQEAIAQRAYEIWLEEGSPNGWDVRHWLQAQAELLEEAGNPHDPEVSG